MRETDFVPPIPFEHKGKYVTVTPFEVEGGFAARYRIEDTDPGIVRFVTSPHAQTVVPGPYERAAMARTAGADAARAEIDALALE